MSEPASPSFARVMWALIKETFQQAQASGMMITMLAITVIFSVLCLSISVENDTLGELPQGEEFLPRNDPKRKEAEKDGFVFNEAKMNVLFGLFQVKLGRDAKDAVKFLQIFIAGYVASAGGILLALIWTAGFLPSFVQRNVVSVLLAKPVPRWWLLLGKFLGVNFFVFVQAVLFLGGTWLALGIRNGVWNPEYWLCLPFLMLQFASFYCFSMLLAVFAKSTVVCVFGSMIFWFVCWAMNFGQHQLSQLIATRPELGLDGPIKWMVDFFYWIMPKPFDLNILFHHYLKVEGFLAQQTKITASLDQGWMPLAVMGSSLLFPLFLFFATVVQFDDTDY